MGTRCPSSVTRVNISRVTSRNTEAPIPVKLASVSPKFSCDPWTQLNQLGNCFLYSVD